MKHLWMVALALAGFSAAAEDDLVAKRDAKLQEPFLKKSAWLTDYDQARAEAKKSGKPIFGYFTRSYAH